MQDDITNKSKNAKGGIKRRDDTGGHYKGDGWCMRTLQKRGMLRKEVIIKGRDSA